MVAREVDRMTALDDREGVAQSRAGLIGLVGSLVDSATGLGALGFDALLLGLETSSSTPSR
jgi:hypothetical protein